MAPRQLSEVDPSGFTGECSFTGTMSREHKVGPAQVVHSPVLASTEMSWREFVAELAGSLAWPALVLALVVILRKNLGTMIRAAGVLQRLKVGPSGLELEWVREKLEDADAAVATASAHSSASGAVEKQSADERIELLDLAMVSPRAAVVEAFTRIEGVLRSLVEIPGGARQPSTRMLARLAVEQFWVSDELAAAVADLSSVRNGLVHGAFEVGADEAEHYVNLAAAVLIILRASPPRRNPEG